jgi:molybdopterin-biosynthesis enzyme MoeA-like protein
VQQSDFTIHSTSEHLDKILMSDESCDYFYKIRIPQQIRKQLLVQLDAIGFHESSIYPDMEHIAREEANMYFNSQN